MQAILDFPSLSRAVDAARFMVRGWVWLGEGRQSEVAAVEAWSGDTLLGETSTLAPRGDVIAALGLPAGARTGFDFFAWHPLAASVRGFDIGLRLRLRDGTRTELFCQRPVSVLSKSAASVPTAAVGQPPTAPGGAADGPDALPPGHLQHRQVAGVWGPSFYSEGRKILDQLAAAFREAGKPLETAESILDFGCGCGRVLRNFRDFPHTGDIWGCDIDAESIAWDRTHLADIGRFSANPTLPPTEFGNGQFDAIYAVSVFTHLPEEMQYAWLSELRRILRPGGVLVASYHGANHWDVGDPILKDEVETRGFAYRTGDPTEGLPDFYMHAFQTPANIRKRWSWFFDVVAIRQTYIHGLQDAAILRRRND